MTKARFDKLGVRTGQVRVLTRTFVSTVEPENLKSVLAGDFASWGLGGVRKGLLRPLFGEGIFTTDGVEYGVFFFVDHWKAFSWVQ